MSGKLPESMIGALGTIAAAVIVLVGGFYFYAEQKLMDEAFQIREAKRDVYSSFLKSHVLALSRANSHGAIAESNSLQTSLSVWASDEVLEQLAKYENARNSKASPADKCALTALTFEALLAEMRNDVFEGSHKDFFIMMDAIPIQFC